MPAVRATGAKLGRRFLASAWKSRRPAVALARGGRDIGVEGLRNQANAKHAAVVTISSVLKLNRNQRRFGFGGWVVVDMAALSRPPRARATAGRRDWWRNSRPMPKTDAPASPLLHERQATRLRTRRESAGLRTPVVSVVDRSSSRGVVVYKVDRLSRSLLAAATWPSRIRNAAIVS